MTTDPVSALLTACSDLLGPLGNITTQSTPWFSATFSGARHVLRFDVGDSADIDSFIGTISEVEIPIRHGFVADAIAHHQARQVTFEALTIVAA